MSAQYLTFENYQAAIGLPSRFFSDPDIARRVVRRDPLGVPAYASGRFAITFRFQLPDGQAPIAVRCFKQSIPDLGRRYAAIARFLGRLRSEFFADFQFSDPLTGGGLGVLVGGKWLPVMRMDWIEGVNLTEAVRRRLGQPAALQALRQSLLRYAELSEREGFAHGDIHGDNILVTETGALRLVDYDGMYVPELRGMPGAVAGQADYQSPLRMQAPELFTAALDRFPLLVLDLSLAALAARPELIERRSAGDGILLGKADLDHPQASALLAEIERLPGFAAGVRTLRAACALPIADVPSLSRFAPSLPAITKARAGQPYRQAPLPGNQAAIARRWPRRMVRIAGLAMTGLAMAATILPQPTASVAPVPVPLIPIAIVSPGKAPLGPAPASFRLNVRSAPNAHAPRIAALRAGDRVLIIRDMANGWVEIQAETPPGTLHGYVNLNFLVMSEATTP